MKFTLDLAKLDLNLRYVYFSAPFPTEDDIRLYIFISFRKRCLGLVYIKDNFEIRQDKDVSWTWRELTIKGCNPVMLPEDIFLLGEGENAAEVYVFLGRQGNIKHLLFHQNQNI